MKINRLIYEDIWIKYGITEKQALQSSFGLVGAPFLFLKWPCGLV
jgi:hypothetical protein